MKSILIFLIGLCATFTAIQAQPIPVSTHSSSQIVQGPCYIFSTIAALESNAMQNGGSSMNFNEWQFYSSCVMGALGSTAGIMIPKSVEHFADHGAFSGAHASPNAFTCPNPNDFFAPCIADFNCAENSTWCENNMMYISTPESNCPDNENTNFEFMPSVGGALYNITPAADGSYWKKISLTGQSNASKSNQIKTLLDGNTGVIANFVNWRTAGAHSLFIYGYSGLSWNYKDSWPGEAGLQFGKLDLSKLTEIYYISGTVQSANPPSCSKSISGSGSVINETNYSLSGSGSASGISWSVSSNLAMVSGQGSTILKVRPNTCNNTTGTITVTYNGNCTELKTVAINGASPVPNGIVVASPNWNAAGQTCPNTTLELFATNNSGHSNLQYNWSIAGATLLSGQGTSSVMVKTPSSNSYLSFRVRTKRANCPYSQWRSLNGYSSASNPGCGLGGGGGWFRLGSNDPRALNFEDFFINHPSVEKVSVDVYTIAGVRLFEGQIDKNNPFFNINDSDLTGLLVIHVHDRSNGVSHSFKHWIGQ